MKRIKRIIAFGCSYTSGEELLYHQFGELDTYRIETAKNPMLFFNMVSRDPVLQEKLEQIRVDQLNLAWPAILAKKFKTTCVNFAEVGNSLDKILWQIEQKRYEGFFQKGDLVLIGLTNPDRNLFFKKDRPMAFQLPSLFWGTGSPIGVDYDGSIDTLVDVETDKHFVHWFTEDRIAWDYYKSLRYIESLQKEINLYAVHAMMPFWIEPKDLQEYNAQLFEYIESSLTTYRDIFAGDKCIDDFATDADYHAWGHPKASVHQKFADYLYEVLRELPSSN